MQELENGDHKASLGTYQEHVSKKMLNQATLAILDMCEAEIRKIIV
jgi:hypothetical protein